MPKSFVSCSHMNCYLQNYTTHQSTDFIDYFIQGIIKNPRIDKILHLHQKIYSLQVRKFGTTCFYFLHHLNFNLIRFSGEPMTQQTCQSFDNVNPVGM